MEAFPEALLGDYANIQVMGTQDATAAVNQVYATVENGISCTKTSIATSTQPTDAPINPLGLVATALPTNADALISKFTAVVGDVTQVLPIPTALPTGLLPLLDAINVPQINIPGVIGNGSGPCVKDNDGNQVGFCGSGPLVQDSESIQV
jgi:hypothetical protein